MSLVVLKTYSLPLHDLVLRLSFTQYLCAFDVVGTSAPLSKLEKSALLAKRSKVSDILDVFGIHHVHLIVF